jgi:hypothetical protein
LVETNIDAHVSDLSLADSERGGDFNGSERLRVVYVTEQISHHPPISAYFASCPARSLEIMGIDQISAKVSGTTLRVSPGSFNKGIFLKMTGGHGSGELYNITHPVASVNGLLRGSFYVTVGESTIITCSGGKRGQKLRAIIDYKDEVRYSSNGHDDGSDPLLLSVLAREGPFSVGRCYSFLSGRRDTTRGMDEG